jgi:transposase-like protein
MHCGLAAREGRGINPPLSRYSVTEEDALMAAIAERQRAYRERHLKADTGTKARLNLLLDASSKLALKQLARHYGCTQPELLTRLLREAQKRVLTILSGDQQNAYYDAVTK